MHAARNIVILFMTLAFLGWGFLLCLVGAKLLVIEDTWSTAGVSLLVGILCSVVGLIVTADCLVWNLRWKNLLIALCGLCAAVAWLLCLYVSGVDLIKAWDAAIPAILPLPLSLIIAGGFFFLRATRAHPSLQSRLDEE